MEIVSNFPIPHDDRILLRAVVVPLAHGLLPVMITPFTADNKVDYDAVLRIIQWYERMNVTGIFAVCQSSEMFFLDKEERLELARFVIRNTPKHMGVIASRQD